MCLCVCLWKTEVASSIYEDDILSTSTHWWANDLRSAVFHKATRELKATIKQTNKMKSQRKWLAIIFLLIAKLSMCGWVQGRGAKNVRKYMYHCQYEMSQGWSWFLYWQSSCRWHKPGRKGVKFLYLFYVIFSRFSLLTVVLINWLLVSINRLRTSKLAALFSSLWICDY